MKKKIWLIHEGKSDLEFIKKVVFEHQSEKLAGNYEFAQSPDSEIRSNIIKYVTGKEFEILLLFDSDVRDKKLTDKCEFDEIENYVIHKFIEKHDLTEICKEIFECAYVVVLQLETWYLAGCTKNKLRNFTIKREHRLQCKYRKRDIINQFKKKPKDEVFEIRKLRKEILEGNFSVEEAIKHNKSFEVFVNKLDKKFGLKF